jgi:hypothetical protein
MMQVLPEDADSHLASQETACSYGNPKFHYHVHIGLLLTFISMPTQSISHNFFVIHCHLEPQLLFMFKKMWSRG